MRNNAILAYVTTYFGQARHYVGQVKILNYLPAMVNYLVFKLMLVPGQHRHWYICHIKENDCQASSNHLHGVIRRGLRNWLAKFDNCKFLGQIPPFQGRQQYSDFTHLLIEIRQVSFNKVLEMILRWGNSMTFLKLAFQEVLPQTIWVFWVCDFLRFCLSKSHPDALLARLWSLLTCLIWQ